MDAGQSADHSGFIIDAYLLRRRFSSGMSDRIGMFSRFISSCQSNFVPVDAYFCARSKRQATSFRRTEKFQNDPHWRDYLLFYEYFHGDNGSGLGASHQTGWTGTLASLLTIFGSLDREELLKSGMQEVVATLADSPEDTPEQIR